MRQKVLWSIVGVMLLVVGGTAAEAKNFNQLLRGDYAFSGEATCLASPQRVDTTTQPPTVVPGGFNSDDLTPFGLPAAFPYVFSFSVQGVRTFNGDGTGHVTARVVRITHPFALPTPTPFFSRGSASSADFEADFTYEVASDLTFTTESPIFTGTILTGLFAGQTVTITNFPNFSGRMSKDHRTLSLAHDEPTIETQTRFDGNVPPPTEQRICHRSRIHLELKR